MPSSREEPEPEPAVSIMLVPEQDALGVDLSLVRATLAMTPTERLKSLDNALNAHATARPIADE